MGPFFSPPKVAKLLGVDHCKILDWIDSKELIAINIAKTAGKRPRWRISQQALDEFLKSRESIKP